MLLSFSKLTHICLLLIEVEQRLLKRLYVVTYDSQFMRITESSMPLISYHFVLQRRLLAFKRRGWLLTDIPTRRSLNFVNIIIELLPSNKKSLSLFLSNINQRWKIERCWKNKLYTIWSYPKKKKEMCVNDLVAELVTIQGEQ